MDRWNKLNTVGKKPSPRHSSISILWKGKMYIFGGRLAKNVPHMTVYQFNLENFEWNEIISSTENIPTNRNGAIGALFGNLVYIHGGYSNYYFIENSSLIFNLENYSWSLIKDGPRRTYHAAVVYKDKWYITGGFENKSGNCSGMFRFDFKTHQWENITQEIDNWPSPKHALSLVEKNDIFYMGFGYPSSNDVYMLEMKEKNKKWVLLETFGSFKPDAMYNQSMIVHRNWLYVIGGSFIPQIAKLNLLTKEWEEVLPGKICKLAHTSCVAVGRSIYVFGGEEEYFNDMFQLKFEKGIDEIFNFTKVLKDSELPFLDVFFDIK